jgi:hypothetical protein
MRLLLLTVTIAFAFPLAGASGSRAQCKRSCRRDYDLCRKRAANKQGRKACAAFKKTCNHSCLAT